MVKKTETRKLIAMLEKKSRKNRKKIWKSIAETLEKPSRNEVKVNIEKLNKLSKKDKGKIFLVPGKVLSKGILEEKITIVGVNASQRAIQKIEKKGKFVYLKDFIEEKVSVKEIKMVK